MDDSSGPVSITAALQSARAQSGESLLDLSHQSPLLLVVLRHSGCPFCRELLANLAGARADIETAGVRPVLIHMMEETEAAKLFGRYHLADLPRVSDPGQHLHQALELKRGSALDVIGPKVWWPGFKAVLLRGHRPGRPAGDVLQLGGAILVQDGKVIAAYRSEHSFDQPDFCALIPDERSG